LQASAFQIGSQARSSQAHIIYDQASGALLYDPDGNGPMHAQQFTLVNPGLQLTQNDFIVG
jgi:Ca2+-binding RTX toxin-like protein